MRNINFSRAVRPPSRDTVRGSILQTSDMVRALFAPDDRVELRWQIPRRDLMRIALPAAEVPERAGDLHVEHFERGVRLSVSPLPPRPDDSMPGRAPTTSFLPPDISVLAVMLAAQPDLIDRLQRFALKPNVVIDAGATVDVIWRLADVIDRTEFQQLGNAIRCMFGQPQDGPVVATEIILPGFQTLCRSNGKRALVGPVHGEPWALKNMRFICEPFTSNRTGDRRRSDQM